MPESPATPRTVAVIGAGIAGLSCAKALQAEGLAVQVLEKSRGVGGRMSTRRGEGWEYDHGAQYFTARAESFQQELATWIVAGVAQRWSPRLCVVDEKGDVVRTSHVSKTIRYVGVPSMTAPAKYLAQSLVVTLDSQVDKLRREPLGWRLHIRGKGWQDDLFDALVLALPAPLARTLLPVEAEMFTRLLAGVQMRPAWALIMVLDDDVDLGFDAAFVNSGPIRWIARESSKPMRRGENLYVLHANSRWSEAHLEGDVKEVESLLVEAFGELFGVLPRVSSLHRWRFADTEAPLGRSYLWDADLGLGLCGDWLKGSKVEGAWLSASRLAKRMLTSEKEDFFDVEFVSVVFGGEVYKSALNLRNEILRRPLGRSLDMTDLAGEETQLHFGLMTEKGELLACLSAKEVDEKHYKFRQMAVVAANQGEGLGAKLIAEVEHTLATQGVNMISLHARESAIGFYEKLAYRCSGNLFDEVGIPHIKMQKYFP